MQFNNQHYIVMSHKIREALLKDVDALWRTTIDMRYGQMLVKRSQRLVERALVMLGRVEDAPSKTVAMRELDQVFLHAGKMLTMGSCLITGAVKVPDAVECEVALRVLMAGMQDDAA